VQQIRSLLLRLVTPDGTRRVLPRAELLEGLGDDADALLHRLVQARLVTSSRPEPGGQMRVELVHEALVEVWSRLRRWIDESREELVFLEEIGRAADLWDRRGRRDEALWQDESLRDARRALAACAVEVPERVRRFVEASLRRQRQRGRRRRLLVALAFVVLATVAALLAVKEQETRREQVRAVRHQSTAEAEGARAALLRGDMMEARAKLRSSLEVRDSVLGRALLWRLGQQPLLWHKGLAGFPYAISFAPDGRSIAAACQDKTIYLIDTRSREVRLLRGHPEQPMAVAHAPDGRLLASGDWGGEVRLWRLPGGDATTLGRHEDRVWQVRFSPDGRQLASASQQQLVLWDVASRARGRAIPSSLSRFGGLSYSPGGKRLAAGCRDGAVRIYEVSTGRLVRTLAGHERDVRGVAFAPDGRRLVSGSSDHTLRIWDLPTGRTLHRIAAHRSGLRQVAFAPDGRSVASASLDHTVRIWDAATGKLTRIFDDHTGSVYGVTYSADGKLLASASFDREIRLWDTTVNDGDGDGPARPGPHRSSTYAVDVSPDGRLVASASEDKTARIWDARTGAVRRVLRFDHSVWGVAFSPDGRRLATGSRRVLIHDLASGAQVELKGHTGGVDDVAFSRDGARLAAAIDDGEILVWDVATRRIARRLRGHGEAVIAVTFSPDGARLASTSRDSTARIWDLQGGASPLVLKGHRSGVKGAAFSLDGGRLYTCGEDRTVRAWDLATGQGRVLARHPHRLSGLRLTPAGDEAVVAAADGITRIVALPSGALKRVLTGHRGEVNRLRLSRDGKLAVTSSDDETVRLWDVATGRPRWWAPALLRDPPQLLSHRGWERLDGGGPAGPPSAWRRAVTQRARRAVEAPRSSLLCIQTHDGEVELWDRRAHRRLRREATPGVQQIQALDDGCLILARTTGGVGRAALVRRAGVTPLAVKDASAIAVHRGRSRQHDRILVAARRQVTTFDLAGRPLSRHACDPGVQALARVGSWLALGNQDGHIDLVPARGAGPAPLFSFQETPSSSVVRILEGPAQTMIAGFANGTISIWSTGNGVLLHSARLHGPVVHMLLRAGKLHAATELGDHRLLNLSALSQPYCELMQRLWSAVPVVWEDGLPRLRPPPADHACRRDRR